MREVVDVIIWKLFHVVVYCAILWVYFVDCGNCEIKVAIILIHRV